MSEKSKIEWTNSTGGPWLGCTEVSPGCAHCYARELTRNRVAPMIRAAYHAAGVATFVKQLGKDAYFQDEYNGARYNFNLKDAKGGDWLEWPAELRVREFPL